MSLNLLLPRGGQTDAIAVIAHPTPCAGSAAAGASGPAMHEQVIELPRTAADDPAPHGGGVEQLWLLPPGCYQIAATPLDERGQEVSGCSIQSPAPVQVRDGRTAEIRLQMQCPAPESGAVNVVVETDAPAPDASRDRRDPGRPASAPQEGEPEDGKGGEGPGDKEDGEDEDGEEDEDEDEEEDENGEERDRYAPHPAVSPCSACGYPVPGRCWPEGTCAPPVAPGCTLPAGPAGPRGCAATGSPVVVPPWWSDGSW